MVDKFSEFFAWNSFNQFYDDFVIQSETALPLAAQLIAFT